MSISRLYTGDDGHTHIEELDASSEELSALHDVKRMQFRVSPPGYFSDWHTAPSGK